MTDLAPQSDLRRLVDAYLDGHEPIDTVVPAFADGWTKAMKAIAKTHDRAAPDFLRYELTGIQKQRYLALLDAVSEHLHAKFGARVEWLSTDDEGAA